MKDKLFNTTVPFRKGGENGPIDLDLMTDSLVSSFRINPRKVLTSLIPECVHADAPPHFKMVLVKSLLRIVKEGKDTYKKIDYLTNLSQGLIYLGSLRYQMYIRRLLGLFERYFWYSYNSPVFVSYTAYRNMYKE